VLDAHRPYLLAVAAAQLDSDLQGKAGASDLVQESLLEARRDFTNFQDGPPPQLQAWLKTILLHNVANYRRRYRDTLRRNADREVPLPALDSHARPGEHLPGDSASPSGQAVRNENRERLEQALGRLPGHYRDVIVWRNKEGCSFDDVGRRLGRSAGAAKQLWLRALQQLKLEMGGEL
jgi:RNA polymerase sigma-70 factor (ECF subfamily)